MANQQDQAVSTYNAYFTAIQQVTALVGALDELDNSYTQLDMGTTAAALPTCPLNADGSLGVADAAPVSGNVIDTRIVSALHIAISSYDLGVMVNLAQALSALWKGQVVSQQQYAPHVVAKTKEQ